MKLGAVALDYDGTIATEGVMDPGVRDAIEPQGFVFTRDGQPGPKARSLKDFVDLLAQLPDADLAPHLQRHDFSKWFGQVFRDCPLSTHVRALESRLGIDRPRDLLDDISQVVRARYQITPLGA